MGFRSAREQAQDIEQRSMGSRQPADPPPALKPFIPPEEKKNEPFVSGGRTLRELKASEMFKWTGVGECVEGILRSVEKVIITDRESQTKKQVIQYLIFNEKEQRSYQFLGTWDINSKLSKAYEGRYVAVIYERDNHEIKKNGHPMKVFRIGVEEKPTEKAIEAGTEITDEDIPF